MTTTAARLSAPHTAKGWLQRAPQELLRVLEREQRGEVAEQLRQLREGSN